MANYTLTYDSELKLSKWVGYPDPNYSFDDGRLVWERIVKDEEGKDVIVKTYKDPIEIIADFKPASKVYGVEGNIERNAVKKFGGALKGFVWLDKVSGGGEVVLPFTAPHIFIATGDRLNPELTEIDTDPNSDNYYEVIEGKTRVVVKSFSGIGGAAGAPPTLIAHYKMNDDDATAVVIDETGSHNGEYQLNSIAQNTNTSDETGKILGALDFVGGVNGEMVVIPNHADFTPTLTPFSISTWVNMHNSINFKIASKGIFNASGEWRFELNADSRINFLCYDEDVDSCYIGRITSEVSSLENSWTHLVGTYDGGKFSSGIKIYVNTIRRDSSNLQANQGSFDTVKNFGQVTWIGRQSSTYANGLIDNVTFFSRELDQHDVDFLWNGGNGREDWEPFLGRLNRPLDYPLRRGRYTF